MRIGVDLGGTKIEAVALGPANEILLRRRVPTPAGDYAATVAAIRDLVLSLERDTGRRVPVGIGTPGTVSGKTGLMINCNSTILNGKPLRADTEAALKRPIRLENDANCLALSEAVDGAAEGAAVVFAVILGTGVGGGVVVDRKLRSGLNHIGGEWGHNPLPWMTQAEWPGPHCWCGKRGCIETFLNGAALSELHRGHTGQLLSAATIAAEAEAGSAAALHSLDLYRDRLARALASVVNLLDPDVIVLGGGLSNIGTLYDGLPARIGAYVFTDAMHTPIVPARHGDSSGVRGAAWLNEEPV